MRRWGWLVCAVAAATLTAGCGSTPNKPSDRLSPPQLGACRDLTSADVSAHTNNSPVLPCTRPHTAQTFLVGTLPTSTGSSYNSAPQGAYVYRKCRPAFGRFIGADDSTVLRIQFNWAWFGPSREGWQRGARWFRCDLVGGADGARTLTDLPAKAKGMFERVRQDAWFTCAHGPSFSGAVRVPCNKPHDWRAVSTIVLGSPGAPYPGDRFSEVRARDYCSDAVGAWLNYQPDYEYGYTYFHKAQWQAGNRRAICWAKTTR